MVTTLNFNHNTKKGLKIVRTLYGGIQWIYVNGKHDLSVICHTGSYGHRSGQFEIMPSWKKPCKDDDVLGYLTFGEVQKWINKLMKLGGEE